MGLEFGQLTEDLLTNVLGKPIKQILSTKRLQMFSVIIPTYNRKDLLLRSINSVINQTLPNWELIIIDDGSTDHTSELVKSIISSEKRIKYVQLDVNRGVANARNVGVSLASNPYVCFLDSDDEWRLDKLEQQSNFLSTNSEATFIFSSYVKVSKRLKVISYIGPYTYTALLRYNFIPLSTVCIHHTILNRFSFPNNKHEDYSLWLNIFYDNPQIGYIDEPLINYFCHDGNLTKNKLLSILWVFGVFRSHRGLIFALYRFPNFVFFRLYAALKGFVSA